MKYFVIFLIFIGFSGIVYATHDPHQPMPHSIILPPDLKDAPFEEFMKWCIPYYGDKCIELEKKRVPILLSPLKQIQSGISIDEIQCKENLILLQKYDSSPACVTESTKLKLIERGWAKTNSIQVRNPVSIPIPPDPMHITINGSTTPFVIPIKAGETKSIDILLEPKIPIVYSTVNVESYFGSAGECKDIDIVSYCPGRGIDMVLSDTSITSQKEITLTINVSDNVTNGTYAYRVTTYTVVESPDSKLRTVGNSLRFDLKIK